jgi:lysophospholipase L1-like esterase
VSRPRWIARLALASASTLVALVLVGEVGLRLWNPPAVQLFETSFRGAAGERVVKIDRRYEVHPDTGIFQVDELLGYRPVPGGKGYGPHGAKWNEYSPERPPGKRRLLFIGDSVTQRAKLVEALQALLGPNYEYWNAGVPGYATEQEYLYYRDYLDGLAADHVLLTFHLNDYETTPVVFESGGEYVAVRAKVGGRAPSAWWMKHSFLYRFGWTLRVRANRGTLDSALEAEVATNLEHLRDLVRARGAEFTVLVLPWLQEPERWNDSLRRHHELVLATLGRLGIPHYSFLPELAQAFAKGEVVHEKGVDPQHPSEAFAQRMASALLATGFRP